MRVLLCPFCPRQEVAALRKPAPLRVCQQDVVCCRCSRWVQWAAQGCAQPGLGQWSGKQMAAPSGKQGGGQSPGTCWNKIIRFRLGMPMRFSCTDPAGTAAVPSRDCRTSHRVEHSGCCKIRTVVIPEQICNVRERIWILNMNSKALPVEQSHSPTAPVHTNLPKGHLGYTSDSTFRDYFFFYLEIA